MQSGVYLKSEHYNGMLHCRNGVQYNCFELRERHALKTMVEKGIAAGDDPKKFQQVSERSERALRKTCMRASERSEQQAKRAASEASSKRSELVATSVGVGVAGLEEDENTMRWISRGLAADKYNWLHPQLN